ncbi:chemotaxis protein CheA [Defluviimonas salinarum]|uniref:Chemotaxis protein CheA n=1 Tax=Defluviimonas salinarum TaxID=2992147 RepID=A0ABT3IXG8_9RHOB|nr:chemotaxis protein CheA [Defluviimonas salinarum]MCW3780117.1 chemotaxis protein CheA [Defluviimonas salinarum]
MSTPGDSMDRLRAGFHVECEEQIERLRDALGMVEAACDRGCTPDPETVNVAFRAVHTIKGGASAFALRPLVSFAHRMESTLEGVRSGAIPVDGATTAALIRATDQLADLVSAGATGDDMTTEERTFADPADTPGDADRNWRVRFRPRATLFATGNEPLYLLQALSALGASEVICDMSALPPLSQLDPETAYVGWSLALPGDRDRSEIVEIFDFVEDVCDVVIDRSTSEREATPPVAVPSEDTQPGTEPARSIRVDLNRVDRVMNLVGELAIAQSILSQAIRDAGLATDSGISPRLEALSALTRDIHDTVMMIRAQPVKPLFQRMGRILRETADALGKPARLRTEGDLTEVDRTVIEQLADPLMHMIRNAVDHGLEPVDLRRRAGKSDEGTITLTAAHRAGRFVVDLADDGPGLDRARIRAAAVAKGLIDAATVLSDAEVDQLLFRPGFSTAASVNDVSGRGVGLDAVRTAIARLGGRLSIQSDIGRGTRFTMSLPLTLAVLNGLIVRVAGQILVIPVAAVVESAAVRALERRDLGPGRELLRIRDSFVPLCDVAETLGYRTSGARPQDAIAILTEAEADMRSALVVDAILDQRQVVVKPVHGAFTRPRGIAAATILGDGQIALILDPGDLVRPTGRQAAPAVSGLTGETIR